MPNRFPLQLLKSGRRDIRWAYGMPVAIHTRWLVKIHNQQVLKIDFVCTQWPNNLIHTIKWYNPRLMGYHLNRKRYKFHSSLNRPSYLCFLSDLIIVYHDIDFMKKGYMIYFIYLCLFFFSPEENTKKP